MIHIEKPIKLLKVPNDSAIEVEFIGEVQKFYYYLYCSNKIFYKEEDARTPKKGNSFLEQNFCFVLTNLDEIMLFQIPLPAFNEINRTGSYFNARYQIEKSGRGIQTRYGVMCVGGGRTSKESKEIDNFLKENSVEGVLNSYNLLYKKKNIIKVNRFDLMDLD